MAPVNILADYPGGGQALMDFLEFVMNGGLAFQMLTVQALDELMSWLVALEVRVVAVTQVELAVGGRVVADPPAARFVTVVLPEQRVDGDADRAENAELFKVRAEPGPEPVIGPGLVDGARMYLQPVPHQPRVLSQMPRRTTTAQAAKTMTIGRHFSAVHLPAANPLLGVLAAPELECDDDLGDAAEQGEEPDP
jgi:hypothetical protein